MGEILNTLTAAVNLLVGVGIFIILIRLAGLIEKLGDSLVSRRTEGSQSHQDLTSKQEKK